MKKVVGLFVLMLALLLTGCTYPKEEEQAQYLLYFRKVELKDAAGSDALSPEGILAEEVPEGDVEETARYLMEKLLEGPVDESLRNTIPAGTELLSLSVEKGRAQVDLSSLYAGLSGVNLTLADAAIVMTLTQLSDIYSVKITVNGRGLAYRERQEFWEADMLLSPKADVVGTIEAVLYFPTEEGVLMPEHRMLELYEGDTQAEAVAQALEEAPQTKELFPAQPEGFRVQGVWLEEETCYVNLLSGLLEGMSEEPPMEIALRSLARSLCELEAVEEVRFLVDGEFVKRYGGVDISRAFTELEF